MGNRGSSKNFSPGADTGPSSISSTATPDPLQLQQPKYRPARQSERLKTSPSLSEVRAQDRSSPVAMTTDQLDQVVCSFSSFLFSFSYVLIGFSISSVDCFLREFEYYCIVFLSGCCFCCYPEKEECFLDCHLREFLCLGNSF